MYRKKVYCKNKALCSDWLWGLSSPCLCVGVSYIASSEFEAITGIGTSFSGSLDEQELGDINFLISLREGDLNLPEYGVLCNTS